MLQALGVLGGVFEGWQQGKEAQRRRRLQDLQAESYELRNDGQRLSNRYDQDTYDTRVDREHFVTDRAGSDAERAVFQADLAQSQAELHAELYPFEVDLASAKVDTERNRTAKEGNLAQHYANTAGSSAVRLRIDQSTEDSRTDALTNQYFAQSSQAKRELLDDRREFVAQNLELGFGAINTNGKLNGTVVEVARSMGIDANRVLYQDGQVHFVQTDENGQVTNVVQSMTEDEFGNGIANDEIFDEVAQRLAQRELVQQQEQQDGVAARREASLSAQEVGVATDQARNYADTAEELAPGITQLRTQLGELQARQEELDEALSGTGSPAASRDQYGRLVYSNDRAELEEEMATVDSQIGATTKALSQLGSTYEQELSRGVGGDGWNAEVDRLQSEGVNSVINDYENNKASIGALTNHSETVARASGKSTLDVRSDMSGRAPVGETQEEALQRRVDRNTNITSLEGVVDDTATEIAALVDSYNSEVLGKDDRPNGTGAEAQVQVRGFLAENPDIARDMEASQQGRRAMKAMLEDAAIIFADSGTPLSGTVGAVLNYERAGSKEAFVGMYQSDYWDSDKIEDGVGGRRVRMAAAQEAARLFEDGNTNSVQEAINAAIQQVESGRISAVEQPRRTGPPTLNDLR